MPAGWGPIAEVASEVASGLDPLVTRITDCIAAEIPTYRSGTVPLDDLRASVDRNLAALLVGLAEHRGPTAHEVAMRRELGVRRALQGVPADALIQAYHIGCREVWQALVRAVADRDPQTSPQLLGAATTVWRWVHEVTDALAAAHAGTTRSLEARAAGARQRFVEILAAGDLDGAEASGIARSLGFDADGDYTVVVLRAERGDLDAVALQHEVDGIDGRQVAVARGALVVVVSQAGDTAAVPAACRTVLPDATLAIGAQRPGLRGARGSLQDAEQTLLVTDERGTARFEDAWLWATLTDRRERLRPLLAGGAEVAASHPHLAATVRSFADGGFSVSAAARRLGVHANTVAYRLDRWEALTGWDPRSFPGLARSLACLRLPS